VIVEAPAVEPQPDASQAREITVQLLDIELDRRRSIAQRRAVLVGLRLDQREAIVQRAIDPNALELGSKRRARAREQARKSA
jgi:hypothetical protein